MIYLKSIFQGPTAAKFYRNSKLREKHFSNFKIQEVQAPCTPFGRPYKQRYYIHKGKPRSSLNKLTRLPHKLGLCNRNPNFRLHLWLHHGPNTPWLRPFCNT